MQRLPRVLPPGRLRRTRRFLERTCPTIWDGDERSRPGATKSPRKTGSTAHRNGTIPTANAIRASAGFPGHGRVPAPPRLPQGPRRQDFAVEHVRIVREIIYSGVLVVERAPVYRRGRPARLQRPVRPRRDRQGCVRTSGSTHRVRLRVIGAPAVLGGLGDFSKSKPSAMTSVEPYGTMKRTAPVGFACCAIS
jgi:hypothetical protein